MNGRLSRAEMAASLATLAGVLALWWGISHAALISRILHPVGQAIAAKAREIHHVDVLHIGAIAQMGDEAAKGGSFQFQLCFGVDAHFCISLNLASVAASAARLG